MVSKRHENWPFLVERPDERPAFFGLGRVEILF
jgi:hypothetical protein